jgi:predicted nucleic acid-binding protein
LSFLLDTDICSSYLKGNRQCWQRFLQYGGQLRVSEVTVGELYAWALRRKVSPKRFHGLMEMLDLVETHDVTREISRRFGELRAARLDAGQAAPEMDLLIAATALVHGHTLVTHNLKDFANIPDLSIEDWLK